MLKANCFRNVLLLVFACSSLAGSAQDWVLHKDKDGIAVYTRKATGQAIKDVRINMTINSSMTELVAALEDYEMQEDWVRNTKECRKIETLSSSHSQIYIATNFPFPAKDRDVVLEYKRVQDPSSKVISISYETVSGILATDSDFVRIPALKASYSLTPVSAGVVEVEYYIRTDIGGSIPKWIINLAISVGPRDTMIALKKLLASGKYKEVVVDGVVEAF